MTVTDKSSSLQVIEASGSALVWFVVGIMKSAVFRGMYVFALAPYSSSSKGHRPHFLNALALLTQ